MDQLTISDIPKWALSGETVVRFAGRDFSQTVDEYAAWLSTLAINVGLTADLLPLADPPAVLVRFRIPGDSLPVVEPFVDPLIKVSKKTCPWLFCVHPSCRNRVTVPGAVCAAHR